MQNVDRGYVEQFIEKIISDEQIKVFKTEMTALTPYVKSVEDAIFGMVLGTTMTVCLDHYLIDYRRKATSEEKTEMLKVIFEKIPQIKLQIIKNLNKDSGNNI